MNIYQFITDFFNLFFQERISKFSSLITTVSPSFTEEVTFLPENFTHQIIHMRFTHATHHTIYFNTVFIIICLPASISVFELN